MDLVTEEKVDRIVEEINELPSEGVRKLMLALGSITSKLQSSLPNKAISIMNEVAGIDCLKPTKQRDYVVARYIVAEYLSRNGFTEYAIGRYLHLNHCTINYAKRRVKEILSLQLSYREEALLYKEFNKKIGNVLHIF